MLATVVGIIGASGVGIIGAAVYTTLAVALSLAAIGLAIAALVLWWDNRTNLRSLDEFLRSRAIDATKALADHEPTPDGA